MSMYGVCFWIFVKESVCIWQINYWISRNREVIALFLLFCTIFRALDMFYHCGIRERFFPYWHACWDLNAFEGFFQNVRMSHVRVSATTLNFSNNSKYIHTHARSFTRDRDDSDFNQSLERRRRGKKINLPFWWWFFSCALYLHIWFRMCICERVLIWVFGSRLWFKYSWAFNGIFCVEAKIRDFVKCE